MAPPHPTQPNRVPLEPDEADPARAILVGRTGLDAALRRDGRIELARCRTPLEAIGELAADDPQGHDPPDEADALHAVVLASDAQPDDPAAFVAAARLASPHAALFLVSSDPAAAPEGFDGVLPPDTTPDSFRDAVLRATLRRSGWLDEPVRPQAASRPAPAPRGTALPRSTTTPPSPVAPRPAAPATTARSAAAGTTAAAHTPPRPADAQPPAPPPAPPPMRPAASPPTPRRGIPAPSATTQQSLGDAALVHALTAGRDLLLPAVELIRARTGAPDVLFVPTPPPASPSGAPAPAAVQPASAPPAQPPAAPGRHHAPVTLGTHLAGWLQSALAAPATLEVHARWLAAWLELQHQQHALQHAALVDELTGAFNRRYFDRFLASAIAQAQRDRHALTLMVLDLDDFKSYNDRFGHPAGDDILRETVRLLRSVIRPSDRVCRIGGDEFAVIFYEPTGPRDPGSRPPDDPLRIAHRFQQQIREHRFPKLGGCAPGTLTVSAGIATYPWDGRSVPELLARADQLALDSKRAGKNAITIGPNAEPHRPDGPCP